MSGKEVEQLIRENVVWSKLPNEVRIVLGNSQREYDKLVLEYSIKNQLRYKGNIVRHVKRNEEMYYDIVLKYSETHLMLYPYHLSDIVVRELRVTPFNYYINIISGLMNAEKSYDSLPNFAAADAVRLLGIGRNQYIELMNQTRSNRKLFRRSRSIRDLLPAAPIDIHIEPWWLVCPGSILESDVKLLSKNEKDVVDLLLDEGAQLVGILDSSVVKNLYNRGLTYFDVPVHDDDFIFVPTLDGFVMNRVIGDYFENLLYQIFVAIDEQTTVKELSETLDIDLGLVKNAVSVFCRLGFAKKRVTGLENIALHSTWAANYNTAPSLNDTATVTTTDFNDASLTSSSNIVDLIECDYDDALMSTSVSHSNDQEHSPSNHGQLLATATAAAAATTATPTPIGSSDGSKRIAFLFDSTLTAFLMMGNLSASLKNHAVTLFEVGKLSDEALDNFVDELQNVKQFVEGEAQRYSEHAQNLLSTILSLRDTSELDLIRGESLFSLDHSTRLRLISKTYRLIVSMAPLSASACPLCTPSLPHFGPAVPEVSSSWFQLYLYSELGDGPISMFIAKGTRLVTLPRIFWKSSNLLIKTSSHEPIIQSIDYCLSTINDTLRTHSVFIQEYSDVIDDSEIVNVPFPFVDCHLEKGETFDEKNATMFTEHESVKRLRHKLSLDSFCGYIVLMKKNHCGSAHTTDEHRHRSDEQHPSADNTSKDACNKRSSSVKHNTNINNNSLISKDPRKVGSSRNSLSAGESLSDYVLLDCIFGIPLFDIQLNTTICERIKTNNLFDLKNLSNASFANRYLTESLRQMIDRYQLPIINDQGIVSNEDVANSRYQPPAQSLLFDGSTVSFVNC